MLALSSLSPLSSPEPPMRWGYLQSACTCVPLFAHQRVVSQVILNLAELATKINHCICSRLTYRGTQTIQHKNFRLSILCFQLIKKFLQLPTLFLFEFELLYSLSMLCVTQKEIKRGTHVKRKTQKPKRPSKFIPGTLMMCKMVIKKLSLEVREVDLRLKFCLTKCGIAHL